MKYPALLFVLSIFTSYTAFSNENINYNNNNKLLSSCHVLKNKPEHINASYCNYFILGFLAKATAINTSIINKQKNIKYKPYRTKGRAPASKFNYYCIPGNASEENIIKIISKQLPLKIDTVKILRDNILTTLSSEYPCKKTNDTLAIIEKQVITNSN